MNFRGLRICCPACHGELSETAAELTCAACGRRFPVLAGIPDLRLFPDPYIDLEADRAKGLHLAARLHTGSFEDLVNYYYSITSAVPPHHARQYMRGLLAAEARANGALDSWHQTSGTAAGGRLLELGCGTAPLLAAAARRGYSVAGIDIAFRWLVIAKKRLLEAGLDVPLICACAEALPFPSDCFDCVVAESALEVVAEQRRAATEAGRVLTPSGWMFVATPNRWSLGPDPHLGVPAGGYWPKRLLAAFAHRAGAVPPRRKLLSASSLKRLLIEAGFSCPTLRLPRIARSQRNQFGNLVRTLIDLYGIAQQLPVSRQFLYLAGPLLHAVAQKPVAPGGSSKIARAVAAVERTR